MVRDVNADAEVRGDYPMQWRVKWFDHSPRGETWGVASIDEVLCYTTPSEQGWADAQRISLAVSCHCYSDHRDHEAHCLVRQVMELGTSTLLWAVTDTSSGSPGGAS